MYNFRFHFIFLLLFSLAGLSTIFARSSASISTLSLVPADSILVLSVDGEKMISKSGILTSKQWNHLLERMEENGSPIRKWLSDSNQSGIAWEEPLQFFVRLIEGERPYPSLVQSSRRARSPKPTTQLAVWRIFLVFAHLRTILRFSSVQLSLSQ